MEERPRRTRQPNFDGPSLPLIPILIGVVVAGFIIGAALSMLGQRGTKEPVAIVTAAPPTPAGLKPSPRATIRAAATTPVPSASRTPQPAPTPKPTPNLTATPASTQVRTPAPTPEPTPARTSVATSAPRVAVVATAPPPIATAPPPALAPRPTPKITPLATPFDEADSDFARLAAGVVRSYLNALARGDDAAAATAISAPAGSRAARLSEKEFADGSMRITSLDAHGTSDSATVNVDLATSKGVYFAQFTLRRLTSGAAVIIDHTFIKP